ncbi:GGDEF domain-containing protein [Paenibacillus dakarensis]|uniref:GGDEF domain-containing protein n=1 Tax=Paenibacillus dakarensis TaxID=1527293 RepID=UPI0006D54009|nr:diguanylate cyclase [Paenibacillus dakarensis]
MIRKSPVRRAELGYTLMILLVIAQQVHFYWNIYEKHIFSTKEILFSLTTLAALLIGFVLPVGVLAVGIFIFLVSYFVWLSTYAPVNILTISWMLFIPANVIIAAFIRSVLIQNHRFIERLEAFKMKNPDIDLNTSLGNKASFSDTLVKQSNLANRYPDQYNFCLAMFKIEFLPLVKESLGSQRYAQLLLELSHTIQDQIRFEDYKFSIDNGRFIILCPLTQPENIKNLTDRIKQAMMDMPFIDKHGRTLKLVIRAGAIVFQKDQFRKYEDSDAVIAALDRNTETDLIGEYI